MTNLSFISPDNYFINELFIQAFARLLVWTLASARTSSASPVPLTPRVTRRRQQQRRQRPASLLEPVPLLPRALPPLKAVLISHDHYDHLDRGAIELLAANVEHFVVPTGVGSHLVRWGVDRGMHSAPQP